LTKISPATIPGNSPSWWDQFTATISGLFGGSNKAPTNSAHTSANGELTLPNVK
jgi:hypothetical protein